MIHLRTLCVSTVPLAFDLTCYGDVRQIRPFAEIRDLDGNHLRSLDVSLFNKNTVLDWLCVDWGQGEPPWE